MACGSEATNEAGPLHDDHAWSALELVPRPRKSVVAQYPQVRGADSTYYRLAVESGGPSNRWAEVADDGTFRRLVETAEPGECPLTSAAWESASPEPEFPDRE